MIITIDGPSGTGKSTIAKRVASVLGFAFFDTGAMYRALAWEILQKQISIENATALKEVLNSFNFNIQEHAEGKRYSVNGIDVTDSIRTPVISTKASEIATLPVIRELLRDIQRKFAKNIDAVFEGRDMGTVVFPNAEVKIFLTANVDVRSERRFNEIISTSASLTREQVLQDLKERDERDSTRKCAPLKKPLDAKEIDTSDLTIDEVVTLVLAYVKEKG